MSAHRADVEPRTGHDDRPPEHRAHSHFYRADIADWWCQTDGTVTDFCSDLSPT